MFFSCLLSKWKNKTRDMLSFFDPFPSCNRESRLWLIPTIWYARSCRPWMPSPPSNSQVLIFSIFYFYSYGLYFIMHVWIPIFQRTTEKRLRDKKRVGGTFKVTCVRRIKWRVYTWKIIYYETNLIHFTESSDHRKMDDEGKNSIRVFLMLHYHLVQ